MTISEGLQLVFLGLFVIFLVIFLIWNILGRILLHYRKVSVTGQITQRVLIYGIGVGFIGFASYAFKYSYTYNGKYFEHIQLVNKSTYDFWGEGERVEVYCFPAFARIARMRTGIYFYPKDRDSLSNSLSDSFGRK